MLELQIHKNFKLYTMRCTTDKAKYCCSHFSCRLSMMSPEPLYFPLGYVTRHAFKRGNHIVVLWLEAFPNPASYLADINVFRRKLRGNFLENMWHHHSTGNIYPTQIATGLTNGTFQRELRDARKVALIDVPCF